jgi:hypothetical protein
MKVLPRTRDLPGYAVSAPAAVPALCSQAEAGDKKKTCAEY